MPTVIRYIRKDIKAKMFIEYLYKVYDNNLLCLTNIIY